MIASQPWSSSQRASATVVADERIFAPRRLYAVQQRLFRETEMKPDDFRTVLLDEETGLFVERGPVGRRNGHLRIETELHVVRAQSCPPPLLPFGIECGRPVAEEVDVDRA